MVPLTATIGSFFTELNTPNHARYASKIREHCENQRSNMLQQTLEWARS